MNLQEIAERLFGAVFGAGGGTLVHTHFSKTQDSNYCRLLRSHAPARAVSVPGSPALCVWCCRWCCGRGAYHGAAAGLGCWVLGAGAVVLELWCLRCGAGAGAVVPALWCCGAGAGAVVLVLWCWVLPAAWRAQFPCARIGCIPHEVQGHMRTRAGHAAYALAPTHKPRVVGYRTRPRGCFEVRAKRGTVEASPTPLRNPT